MLGIYPEYLYVVARKFKTAWLKKSTHLLAGEKIYLTCQYTWFLLPNYYLFQRKYLQLMILHILWKSPKCFKYHEHISGTSIFNLISSMLHWLINYQNLMTIWMQFIIQGSWPKHAMVFSNQYFGNTNDLWIIQSNHHHFHLFQGFCDD